VSEYILPGTGGWIACTAAAFAAGLAGAWISVVIVALVMVFPL
jgi:hypothetical protein